MNNKYLYKLLEKSYKKIPGCDIIVVGSQDGISMASYPRENEIVDSIAATSTSITGLSDAASEYLEKGQVQYSLVRSKKGFFLVIGADRFNLFIMTSNKVNLGLLLLVGNKLADELCQVIDDFVMKNEMEEDIHLLARELSEAVGESKAQMDVVLIDEEGLDVPKDLKEKIDLAGKFANECAQKDIPCEIRITIDEPVITTLHSDHTNLEPTTEKINKGDVVNPEDVRPEQVKYHNETLIYHQEPAKDKPEPSMSPKSHFDETILEPTIHSIPTSPRFIPDEVKPTEVRHMNDSEVNNETTEFKEKAMQEYGVEHDTHTLEPHTETLPEVEKINPEDVKPVEVARMNDSVEYHEPVEFEAKQMQEYGVEHDTHVLEPHTEKLPDVDRVNPEDVQKTFVKWHNEVPIYHEEPKKETPDPTIIPKTDHVDETVLEPTTQSIRYEGTRVLPEEVKAKDVKLLNDSVEYHEPVEFEPKQMQEYGVEHDTHTLEPHTETLPEVEKINPEDVTATAVIHANDSEQDENHDSISEKAINKIVESDQKENTLDPRISNVIERLNIAIEEFKSTEKSSLFGGASNTEENPFTDKDDLTEY